MAEYLSPGVYVEEYDSAPRGMEGVGTSTAGFVGLAQRGPAVGAPELVTNYAGFIRRYGGYLSEFEFGEYRYLAGAVEQFFQNGGTRCYVASATWVAMEARRRPAMNREAPSRPPFTPKDTTPQVPWGRYFRARS